MSLSRIAKRAVARIALAALARNQPRTQFLSRPLHKEPHGTVNLPPSR